MSCANVSSSARAKWKRGKAGIAGELAARQFLAPPLGAAVTLAKNLYRARQRVRIRQLRVAFWGTLAMAIAVGFRALVGKTV
jgi:hypothetical protein